MIIDNLNTSTASTHTHFTHCAPAVERWISGIVNRVAWARFSMNFRLLISCSLSMTMTAGLNTRKTFFRRVRDQCINCNSCSTFVRESVDMKTMITGSRNCLPHAFLKWWTLEHSLIFIRYILNFNVRDTQRNGNIREELGIEGVDLTGFATEDGQNSCFFFISYY